MASPDMPVDTTCGSLLRELQHIWDEVGETDSERDKMLLQLEQADRARVRLHQALAEVDAEISSLMSSLGERSLVGKSEKRSCGTLKEKLVAVQP